MAKVCRVCGGELITEPVAVSVGSAVTCVVCSWCSTPDDGDAVG